MNPLIVLINPPDAEGRARQLDEQLRLPGPEPVRFDTVEDAVSSLRRPAAGDGSAAPVVAVIGPNVAQPVLVARRLHEVVPSLHIVFATHPDRDAVLRREITYAMSAGTLWAVDRADSPGIARIVRNAAQTASRRKQFRTTLDRINLQLASRPPPDAADLRRLVASDHYLANILNHAHDAILSLDARGTVVSWNRGAEELFGLASPDAVGQRLLELARWPDQFAESLARSASGETVRQELHLDLPNAPADLDVTLSPVRDDSDLVIAVTAILRDVTERRRADAERALLLDAERAARTEAERASRLKDEFLATLSHELRTPLNAIIGWSQILRTGKLPPPDAAQAIDVIDRNARAQAQLIEDLLDMSRIVSGKVRLEVQRLDLADVVAAAVQSVQPTADAKGIRLEKVLDPHAGPISGDPNRLQQVVWNLLNNAIKFTPKGGKVQVVLERVNSHLEISVSDTGVGIKPEFLPHVFDRFRQADGATTRQFGGLGLGLSIVKQLVEMHNGHVRAKSAGEGRGATFMVALPLAIAHHEADERRRHPRAPAAGAAELDESELAGLRILVVDDDPDGRALVKRLLENSGATVLTAGSAADGLQALERERPDAIVSDIGMPGMDGYEFIRRVRGLGTPGGGTVPAVAVTAFARSEDRQRALLAGYQSHVAKPMEPAELIAVVASVTGRIGRGPK